MNKNRLLAGRTRLLAVLMLLAAGAQADCLRPVRVPVAALGVSVTTVGGEVGGIYPELLRSIGQKEGCEMAFSVVPRARQEAMFETGQADLLVAATRTSRRERLGAFVPMISSRALLISLATEPARAPLHTLSELLARRELRVAIVRGFDFGDSYQALVKALAQQGRLVRAVDAVSVARSLANGTADVTIMTSTSLVGALQAEPKLRSMIETLRYEAVEELPWGESGVYVSSNGSLADADRLLLREALERSAKTGVVIRAFQRHFPAASLADSVRER